MSPYKDIKKIHSSKFGQVWLGQSYKIWCVLCLMLTKPSYNGHFIFSKIFVY